MIVRPLFDDQRVRALSRLVFGQDHKLSVLLAFSRADKPLTLTDLAHQLGARSASSLQRPLRDLLEAKFVIEEPAHATDRARYYSRRANCAIWALADELYRQLDDQEGLPLDWF